MHVGESHLAAFPFTIRLYDGSSTVEDSILDRGMWNATDRRRRGCGLRQGGGAWACDGRSRKGSPLSRIGKSDLHLTPERSRRLEIQHGRAVDRIQTAHTQHVPLYSQQVHHSDADGVGAARAAQGKDPASRAAPVALRVLKQIKAL
jgi:hypothetical protein